jgi:hypothetical protein
MKYSSICEIIADDLHEQRGRVNNSNNEKTELLEDTLEHGERVGL